MRLDNEFALKAPPDLLWDVLNDVELIAPEVPGFRLREVSGETYSGTMKVKVGAVTVEYAADITVVARDAGRRRIEMAITGRERRGAGTVNATVTSELRPSGDKTVVSLVTELRLTGRVAQFGRGMLADVSASLVEQFVRSLECNVLREPMDGAAAWPAAPARATPAEPTTPKSFGPRANGPAADPADPVVDITAAVGKSAVRRVGSVAVAFAVVLCLYRFARRR